MTRVYTYAVAANPAERTFQGFCDMLRYDGSRVLEHRDDVILLVSDRPPADGRWRSFGIPVLAMTWGQQADPSILEEARAYLPAAKDLPHCDWCRDRVSDVAPCTVCGD